MDTTFPEGTLRGRHGVVRPTSRSPSARRRRERLLAGTVRLARALSAPARAFDGAKAFVVMGAVAGFGVWFAGVMVVGGEWFQMWQSADWNGQEAAFRCYMTILAVLIFVNQPDRELLPRAARERIIRSMRLASSDKMMRKRLNLATGRDGEPLPRTRAAAPAALLSPDLSAFRERDPTSRPEWA